MSHTPGPWHVGGKGNAIVYADVEGGSYAVANAVTFHGQPNFEDAANARLIAAAPDLLEALRKLVGLIMDEHGSGADLLPVHHEFDPEHYAAIREARASIAKAEGR